MWDLELAGIARPHGGRSSGWRTGMLAAATALLLAACGGADRASVGSAASTAEEGRRFALAAGTAAQGGVLINEVHAANWKGALDEDGDVEDWVELYNPGSAAVDLTGYGLSNKSSTPFAWTFPAGTRIAAGGYLRVWLSKKNRAVAGQPLHASFNLDNGADPLLLSASNATATGILVDSATPPLVRPDHSWCRMPSGSAGSPFRICTQPTPEAANTGAAFASMLAKPQFSLASGLYPAAQTVTVTGPAGATIRYTTDGSVPSAASPAYSGPIAVASSQVLRAASFSADALTSPTESHSYVIDAGFASRYAGLKVLFVAMAPEDFTRYQARDKDLNALVHLEMLSAGTRLFKQDADGSVAGNAGSLDSPQVAMNANARDVFGPKDFVSSAVIWPAKPTITKTKKLRIRNGGNDWAAARLRDQLSQDLGSAGPNIIGAATSVAMFVNGQYYALMDLREREDETIVANNTGADKDWVDFLETPLIPGQEIKNGGPAALAAYRQAHEYIVGNDMAVAANYASAQGFVDVTSLAWDWGHHLLLANYDWPNNNVHVFRSPELGGRWTWRPHDFDFAMGRYTGPGYDMNGSYSMVGSPMFAALLRNPGFKNLFLGIAADQMNLMTPSFMNDRLDLIVADMRPYVNDLYTRNGLGGEATWNTRVAELRNWIKLREPAHDQQLRTQFGLGNRGSIGVTINDRTMGTVQVNTLDVGALMPAAAAAFSGRYYPGVPITLEARPKPGHVFVGWRGSSGATGRSISHTIAATPALPADGFAVRWSGQILAPASGEYRFQVIADDGVALRVNGQLLVDHSSPRAEATVNTAPITLSAGQRYDIVAQYFDLSGSATMRLLWLPPGKAEYVPVPATQFYPDAAAPYPTGLFGAYYDNTGFTGTPVAGAIEHIDFAWGTAAPTPSVAQFEAIFEPGTPSQPVLASVAAQSARTGDIVNLVLQASDPNGHTLSFSASGLPKGVGINARSGIIYGRITTPGSYNAIVTASNGALSATQTIAWTVTDRPGTGLLGTSPDSGNPPPANRPPAVALTSPGAALSVTLGASVSLSASASDSDGSVAKVEFFDGGTLIGSAAVAPYTLSWTPAATGARTVTARATDNQGASSTSAGVTVTVQAPAGNTPPAVALTAPAAGLVLANGAATTLSADASDADGIARVEFYDGNQLIGSDNTSPYSVSASFSAAGVHALSARAVDARGATATSAAVNVLVAAAGTVPLPADAVACANEGGSCVIPAGRSATVYYGARGHHLTKSGQSGTVACNNAAFGDPLPSVAKACAYVLAAGGGTGTLPNVLKAEYWSNTGLSGTPTLTRLELPAMDLASGQAPDPRLPSSGFSVRWSGSFTAQGSGTHWFGIRTSSGDGVRLWINNQLLIDSWSSPSTWRQASIILTAGQAVPIRLEFYEVRADARMTLYWVPPGGGSFATVPASRFSAGALDAPGNGLRGVYFAGTSLAGNPLLTRVEAVDHQWGTGAPAAGLPSDNFSVRWTGGMTAPRSGYYRFQTVSDDGIRAWVNNQRVIDNWTVHASTTNTSGWMYLSAGQRVPVKIEFFEQGGIAEVRWRWLVPGSDRFVAVPAASLLPD